MLNDVVCPSTTLCYAVGRYGKAGPGVIIGSSDGGHRWKVLLTTTEAPLSAIACPTADTCVVGGDKLLSSTDIPATFVSTDDGAHWSSETLPKGIFGVDGAACASVKVCLVTGSVGIDRTTNGGTTWIMEKMPSRFFLMGPVACPTRSFCIVGGTGGSSSSLASVSKDAGATWSSAVVAAGPVYSKEDSFASTALGALSCSSAQHCVGLVGDGSLSSFGAGSPIVTSDAGRTWTRGSSGVGWVDSCVGNFCASVGGHLGPLAGRAFVTTGNAFTSTDGGVNWRPSSIPTRLIPTAVSCTSSTHCVAVGGNLPKAKSAMIMTYS